MIERRLSSRLLKTRDSYILKLADMGLRTMKDLFFYFPRTYRDEQSFAKINEMRTDEVNVVQARIKSIMNIRTKTGKTLTRAVVHDETGELPVMWFNQSYIKDMFFKGNDIILTGKLKFQQGKLMMSSPKFEKPSKQLLHTGRIVPVYPESEHITSKWLREKLHPLLPYLEYIDDPLPSWVREKHALMGLPQAVKQLHFPDSQEHLDKAMERMGFEELFRLQLLALQRKREWQAQFTVTEKQQNYDLEPFFYELPFELTGAQQRVIGEIIFDMTKPYPMLRLVQGDVGAGKTAVAAAALFANHQDGRQSVLMAPTEILARQHYKGVSQLMAPFGWNIQLLVGSMTHSQKEDVLRQMASGTCDLVIGTHALIQEYVQFHDLGLAVVDEQHRFGVKQRAMLKTHGTPHMLSLSATPIPRTIALTLYGDQDLSILDEMPPGRQEIITRIIPEKKRQDAYTWITDQINKGRQVFVICPLVEESEQLEVKAATDEYHRLAEEIFPQHKLALLHGRMKADEKDAVMKAFSDGDTDILVSTSVVEVGIDVPNASIMLIEGADRFGLAQLHQFRGRVGRGKHQSYCFLFSDSKTADANKRLNYMVKYNSGFDLAELDLEMRGPGELYGVKQSGLPDIRFANLNDAEFIQMVRETAGEYLDKDPGLEEARFLG